ncbi:MAG: DUF4357 domain-containing protein [Clostridia bacterium]|nr:DUF4357 domain-containing protein [Clostridia bacterium]
MSSKITGKEYPLSKIFSKEFDYYIPAYQRPYAWSQEQTEKLFDDLYDFYREEKNDNFFLGSIVLIKDDDKPHADVIDGQQRLTTLTILISAIATRLSGDNKTNCIRYLTEPGNDLEGLEPLPRLHLRQKDQKFFNEYIQNLKLTELINLDPECLQDESQQHIRENCELILNRLNNKFQDEKQVTEFCKFIVTRCYIVAVYTPVQRSAFRVFSVMNSRGLNLMPTDIIKSDIIGQIPENEQQLYTDKWEDLEVKTSRSGFNDVFTHTRMIFAKTKAKQNLLDEFREAVLTKVSPKELIDDILEPYSIAYTILINKKYVSTKNAEQINHYLFWLNKIDNADWIPSAIKFFAEHKNDSEYVLWFVKKLERLASYLHITAKDLNFRIERYRTVLEEMEENPDHSMDDPLSSIELSNEEKEEFTKVLNSEIYLLTGKRRNYVILRLNEFVGDGASKIDFEPNILTIEHVLPQTVSAGTQWEKIWLKEEERKVWINRIANLVPLTRKKNSEAQNYDFDKKKDVYFKGKNGTTTFPLTTQVLSEKEWSPSVVEKRQKELLDIFIDRWNLRSTTLNRITDEGIFFIKNKRGANAEGYPTETGFVVKKGSKLSDGIVAKFRENYPNAYRLREELTSTIVIGGIMQEDYEFESISLAASVVLGRNASGQKEWTDSTGLKFEETLNIENTASGSFNINDESTYGSLKTGALAYELFKRVIELRAITEEEVERLKTKEYTKQLFNRTDYPILAENREDNRGGSNVVRYRKTPISYNGRYIYITTQWFSENRKDIIAWYRRHL